MSGWRERVRSRGLDRRGTQNDPQRTRDPNHAKSIIDIATGRSKAIAPHFPFAFSRSDDFNEIPNRLAISITVAGGRFNFVAIVSRESDEAASSVNCRHFANDQWPLATAIYFEPFAFSPNSTEEVFQAIGRLRKEARDELSPMRVLAIGIEYALDIPIELSMRDARHASAGPRFSAAIKRQPTLTSANGRLRYFSNN
jgi:hypothetical protein